ncbi:MAG: EAL domain-containing protein [Sulfuricellaceae bacterium]|nr:EAL domain-containing protein [Sulfuricellaceae bacterium]
MRNERVSDAIGPYAFSLRNASLFKIDRNLALVFGAVVLLLMLTMLLSGSWYYRKLLKDEADRQAALTAEVVQQAINRIGVGGQDRVQNLVEDIAANNPEIRYILIAGRDLRIVAHSDSLQLGKFLAGSALSQAEQVFHGSTQVIRDIVVGEEAVKDISVPYRLGSSAEISGIIRVGIARQEWQQQINRGIVYLGALGAVSLLIAMLAIYRISAYFGRPVKNLAWQLQGLLDFAPLLIVISDREGRIQECSHSFHRLFGGDGKSFENAVFYDLLPPAMAKTARAGDRKVLDEGQVLRCEETLQFNNESRTFMITKFPIVKGGDGRTLLMCLIMSDVSERKSMEEILRHSEESSTRALRIARMGNWQWDIPKNELLWSDGIHRIFGTDPAQFKVGYDAFLGKVHAEDRPALIAAVQAAIAGKAEYNLDHRIVLPDGLSRFVHEQGEVIFDEHGDAVRMFGTIQDISERKRAEELLFREKELAQVTLQSIGDAVITTDARGCVTYLNPIAESLTAWRSEEAAGLALPEVFRVVHESSRQPIENPVDRVLRDNVTVALENHSVLNSRDGRVYFIEDSAAPIRDRDGAVIGVVLVFHDVSKAKAMEHQLLHQATHDALTGLVNRSEFEKRLMHLLESAQYSNLRHTLLYLDLDQFKVVNDSCGHVAGDELLRQLTRLMEEKVRESDILARLGGDEFGVLLENCPTEQALRVANTFLELVSGYRFVWQDKRFVIGVSIGLVELRSGSVDTIEKALIAADSACYLAKDSGRNRIQIYQPGDAELAHRSLQVDWVSRLNKAFEEDRFLLYCQAIVPIDFCSLEGDHWEILIRMVDEDGGLVPPGAFIPAAERYNLMARMDRWVIGRTLAVYESKYGARSGKKLGTFSINLSGASLCDDTLLAFIKEQFERHAVPPQLICFEVTETAAIANLTKAMLFIKELRDLGCRFALDDFGSGMSSFAYLKNLHVDYLKIDGAFVRDMVEDEVDCAMVEAINRIGHVMGIQTVAEFVENDAILQKLKDLGVNFAQGYGLHKPEPLSAV